MADPILGYLEVLKRDLKGRIPREALAAVLDESASHLRELTEELGSAEAAVAKFGSPRRFARRVIRESRPVPNPWRAAIFPLGLVLVVEILEAGLPVETFLQYADLLTAGGTFLVLWGFFRARQILWKPLLAFALFHVALASVYFNSQGVPVPVDGQIHLAIARRDGLPKFYEQVDSRLGEMRKIQRQLETGVVLFAKATTPSQIPSDLRFSGGEFTNPETLIAQLGIEDREEPLLAWQPNMFCTTGESMGGADTDLQVAKKSWERDTPSALARVNRQIADLTATRAAAAAAWQQPLWVTLYWDLTMTWKLSLRFSIVVFQFNLLGWALSRLAARFVPPRRRKRLA